MEAILMSLKGVASILSTVKDPDFRELFTRNRWLIFLLLLAGVGCFAWRASLLDVVAYREPERTIVRASRQGRSVQVLDDPEADLLKAYRDGRSLEPIHPFAAALLAERVKLIEDMFGKSGVIRVPAPEVDRVALRMMDYVQESMVATSTDLTWWDDRFGARYQSKNMRVAPFTSITRIFQYANVKELAQLRPILVEQKKARINVYTAEIDTREPPADYVVIDNKLAGVLNLSFDRKPLYAEFTFDKNEVERIKVQIKRIEGRMKEFTE